MINPLQMLLQAAKKAAVEVMGALQVKFVDRSALYFQRSAQCLDGLTQSSFAFAYFCDVVALTAGDLNEGLLLAHDK